MMYRQNQHNRVLFILSVALLIINDFYLKEEYHNEITGKLSDFAGLFAFPYFLSLIYPKSIKANYVFAGIFFTIWKSEFIQPLFDAFKVVGFTFQRIVDYTDLIALTILPVSYYYWKKESIQFCTIFALKPFVILVCCFAFVGTSNPRQMKEINMECNIEVRTPMKLNSVKDRLGYSAVKIEKEYDYVINVSDRDLEINTLIQIKRLPDGEISIRLNTILNQEMRGEFFFGFDDEDEAFADNLKCDDYQKLFLQSLQKKLYK